MSSFISPLVSALLIFPFLSFLFTIPYMLHQYHKYGSLPLLRVVIVYSLILYLTCAYFLVVLPLPAISKVEMMTGPTTQLIPFQFIVDFINHTSLVWNDPATYLTALKEPFFYQWFYNIFLTVPFGIYLRYYFKCSWKKTFGLTFLLTLFFELTQLSGLYGLYPRAYRLFDVDDLFLNTLGGILGFLITPLVEKILPSREELDQLSYKKGERISFTRRLTAFFLDGILFTVVMVLISFSNFQFLGNSVNSFLVLFFLTFLFYYCIIPSLNDGSTLGKQFLKMKMVTSSFSKPKLYQLVIRNCLLYLILLPLPFYLLFGVLSLEKFLNITSLSRLIIILGCFILSFFLYLFCFVRTAIRKKELFYERWSNTKNISVIKQKNYDIIESEKVESDEDDQH